MSTSSALRGRLHEAADSVKAGDAEGLATTAIWLEGLTAPDLVRVDRLARESGQLSSMPTRAQRWHRKVGGSPDVADVLASMHRDGRVREEAVRRLAQSETFLADRMLAVRVGDHVERVRALALEAVLQRVDHHRATAVLPILQALAGRQRGGDLRDICIARLVEREGAEKVWGALRNSRDRGLRRFGFHRSVELGVLDLAAAVALLPAERDDVVWRTVAEMVADRGDAQTLKAVLLSARLPAGRALALVRLPASDLQADDVRPLLVDTSVLVRVWARRRWEELGHDPVRFYRDLTFSATTAKTKALAYVGLLELSVMIDRAEALRLVGSPAPSLQKVGLALLVGKATELDVNQLIDLLFSRSARIARLAGAVLTAQPNLWSVDHLAELKRDGLPEVRRRAWQVHRGRGGWESPIADLELSPEWEKGLARLGSRPTAPMYVRPNEAQVERLRALLLISPIHRYRRLEIAFSAGLLPEMREAIMTSGWILQTGVTAAGT